MKFQDKLLIALTIVLLFAVFVGITEWTHPQQYNQFLNALGDIGRQIFIDLQVLFWVALGLVVLGVLLHYKREHNLVRPGKHGAVQAIVYKNQTIQLAPMTDPELQITQAKQLMQLATMMARASKTVIEEQTVDAEPLATQKPQDLLPAPTRPQETLYLSDAYHVPVDDFLSGRKLFVGISGSGKSNSTATYVEELGRFGVPLVLADTENEYASLCNPQFLPYGVLAGAAGSYAVSVENAYEFGMYILDNNLQVILNLQSYEFEEAARVMVQLIIGMRQWQEERENEHRIPCEFILEEAVTWLPQYVKESPLHGTATFAELQAAFFNDMVRKGRKRGLGLTVICQKIAELDNRAMQADGKLLHRQTEEADLERYRKMGLERDETLSLQDGEAFLYTKRVSKMRVQVRRRRSPHGANTPGLENLRRHQNSSRTNERGVWNGELIRTESLPVVEPVQGSSERSYLRPVEREKTVEDVPSELRTSIERRLISGKGRKEIQADMHLNGDEYWMIKVVADAYEYEKRRA